MRTAIGRWICLYSWILVASTCVGTADFPFRDTSLSWDERVHDLVSRLSLHEIALQMSHGGSGKKGGPAPAIERLGIGPYQFNEECLRGAVQAGWATSFPQALGLAAAFNPKLISDIAEATAIEVRAKHNDFVSKKDYTDHTGLSCFSPVVNIMRHPFWGRNQETYGEDPYLSAVYADRFVRGLQGTHPRYVTANAGCKHFAAYSGPENIPDLRLSFNANVSDRDLRLTFLPAFRACVRAGSYSIKCGYNSVNGIPACASHEFLTNILRQEWDFRGYVVSDEAALESIILFHKYLNNTVDTAAECVKAGCNLEMSLNNPTVYSNIEKAVEQGKLSEILVRQRVKPLFYTRMRLGEFDPPEMNPYSQYNMSMVQTRAHQDLARSAAAQSFVLLKNQNNFLPLLKRYFGLTAILGPMANNVEQTYGDYATPVFRSVAIEAWQGLSLMTSTMNLAPGCYDTKCTDYSKSDIVTAVKGVDLVILCVGTGQEMESEGNDRASMDLPGNQTKLIKDALDATRPGTPVLLIIFSGGPVNIGFADRDPRVTAIMQCFFPAAAGGDSLYPSLAMTDSESAPAGRLPFTWYNTDAQVPPMTNYSMDGRTYRYFKGEPLYPFGYGLSYTTFFYTKVSMIPVIAPGDDQYVSGQVINVGKYDSYEVVQVYVNWTSSKEPMPQLQLVGFDRLFVKAEATVDFQFVIKADQMATWTKKGYVVKTGVMTVYVGGQQPFQKKTVGSNVVTETFTISGVNKYMGKF